MGAFQVEIEVGDPQGERFERVQGLLMAQPSAGDRVAASSSSPRRCSSRSAGDLKVAATVFVQPPA